MTNLTHIIRGINCISTSGIRHSVSVTVWCARLRPAHKTVTDSKQSDIYQRVYWYNWFSWWWARGCSKHVENWNKYIEKNCASIWSFTKNHIKMHGQQNITFFSVTFAPRYWSPPTQSRSNVFSSVDQCIIFSRAEQDRRSNKNIGLMSL
jgi:hypothetical protein